MSRRHDSPNRGKSPCDAIRARSGADNRRRAIDDVRDCLEDAPSGFGTLTAVRHSAIMSETPARWQRPSVPLGTHPPAWP